MSKFKLYIARANTIPEHQTVHAIHYLEKLFGNNVELSWHATHSNYDATKLDNADGMILLSDGYSTMTCGKGIRTELDRATDKGIWVYILTPYHHFRKIGYLGQPDNYHPYLRCVDVHVRSKLISVKTIERKINRHPYGFKYKRKSIL